MAESLVVKAKIKEYCKGMNCSGDLAEALSKKVALLLSDAVARAKANGRKTVQSKDV
jgi:histone H3/H4